MSMADKDVKVLCTPPQSLGIYTARDVADAFIAGYKDGFHDGLKTIDGLTPEHLKKTLIKIYEELSEGMYD
jgi:CBS domain-containing protein